MKYKQNMLDLLDEIKDEVLALEAPAEDIDRISGLIDKAKDYFDDYAFETIEDVEEIKDKMNEILTSALYRIERRSED